MQRLGRQDSEIKENRRVTVQQGVQRERERQTDRQRQRETERQTETETERQRQRDRDRERNYDSDDSLFTGVAGFTIVENFVLKHCKNKDTGKQTNSKQTRNQETAFTKATQGIIKQT